MASVQTPLSASKSDPAPVKVGSGIRFQVTPEVDQPDKLLPTKTADQTLTPQNWNEYIPQGYKLIGIWDKKFRKIKFVDAGYRMPHPFLNAALLAYSKHYPLKLRPDDIWLLILQATGLHINANSETLRSQFVNFEGKKLLEVFRPEFELDSLDNDWGSVSLEFLKKIGESTLGDFKEICETSFSTSTPLDNVARSMTIMHAMQKYFEYVVWCGCGFPYIILEGEKEDWIKLKESSSKLLSKLGKFGDDWSKALLPLLDKMTEPFFGIVDKMFWNAMYTLVPRRLSRTVNWEPRSGWVNILFPYIKPTGSFRTYPYTNPTGPSSSTAKDFHHVLNPFCVPYDEAKVLQTEKMGGKNMANAAPEWDMFPDGRCFAPGKMIFPPKTYAIRFYSGFLGMVQDEEGVVSTQVGWYVLRDLEMPS